jgi:diguanylate cyclase (GGDEF)-like protein
MEDNNNSLTKFEYPSLLIGSNEVAKELENALKTQDVHEHVQRAFYLDNVDLGDQDQFSDVIAGYLDTRYQIVFIDATVPDLVDDRVKCIKLTREICPSSEVVVLISKETEGRLVDLLQAGAWYFLEVPVITNRLALILVRVVSFHEADKLIRVDGLTSLYNRAFFEDALRDQIARLNQASGGQRSTRLPPVSLVVADLDNFGEAFSDDRNQREAFLREVGQILKKTFRVTDVLARVGGDEFAALLSGVNYTLALMRGEIMRKKVDAIRLPDMDPDMQHPSLSVGVVTFPSFLDDPRQLYWHARRALSRSKAEGGDSVYGFDQNGNPTPFSELGG